ncbi:MAG: AAA family ATPase [Capsulimonadaceae bacterium]
MNNDTSFITQLSLQNFLSYGAGETVVKLQPLNVLIGQNASGKSNLIRAIEFLRATATSSLSSFVSEGGGTDAWINKRERNLASAIYANTNYSDQGVTGIRHGIGFRSVQGRFTVDTESIWPIPNEHNMFYYLGSPPYGKLAIWEVDRETNIGKWVERSFNTPIQSNESIVSQRYDPESLRALSYLHDSYKSIKVYRGIQFSGPNSAVSPQRPDLPDDFLEESARNLSMVINDLNVRDVLGTITDRLKTVYSDIDRLSVRISGGAIQVLVHERGIVDPIPAVRLSEGTLRYLSLLTILCHPSPPPLICLEEPEVGLHPDVISSVAELLVEASQRTQLIVTTHSEMLVSALSHVPEAVIVCERGFDGTTLERLDPDSLNIWLEKYTLGDLWLKGELGGTRW